MSITLIKQTILIMAAILIMSKAWCFTSPTYSTTTLYINNTVPHSETTLVSATTYNATVDSSGSATCPQGQVMVGFQVVDSTGAYYTYSATRNVGTDCSGFHFHYTNYSATLMRYPNQLTFRIYCKPIDMAFF